MAEEGKLSWLMSDSFIDKKEYIYSSIITKEYAKL